MFYNVKAEIYRRGWTLTQFADRVGIKIARLSNMLGGKVKISLEDAIRIKKALGSDMPLEQLFAKAEKP